jgi:tRNA 2-thiouridine synthesizing protein A
MAAELSPTVVDARGHRCPMPTLRLRRALEPLPQGARVELWADDPLARIDVPHFASQAGLTVLGLREEGRTLVFTIEKTSSAPSPPQA